MNYHQGVDRCFVVGYHVGCRKGELIRMEWPDVDLKAERITLPVGTTKNKEGRTLPIYGEMLEWLKMARDIRDSEHPNCNAVFQRNGKAMKNFRKAWEAACLFLLISRCARNCAQSC